MITGKKIFIAFTGPRIIQLRPVVKIKRDYECWNLKKFNLDSFITRLKRKIPPINQNVLRNYKRQAGAPDGFGITPEQFANCSYGILIPDKLEGMSVGSSYAETLFLLNLYSPNFLYPVFYATDFGVMAQKHEHYIFTYFHEQNQAKIFKKEKFVDFFEKLLPQSQYGAWLLPRIQGWNDEDWRLFVASLLFKGLTEYDNSKSSFTWQRESADMATVLETLFTAEDNINEEIGYRLRKRMAALLSFKFPTIEDEVKSLYKERSSFVHGGFFKKVATDSRRNLMNMPAPNFHALWRQKEYVRYALISYLYLALAVKEDPAKFGNPKNVMKLLEDSVSDVKLRGKITSSMRELFSMLPKIR